MSNVIRMKDIRQKRNNMSKYLFIVVILLVMVLLLIVQFFNVKSIEIVGNNYYSEEEIMTITGINHKTNLLLYRMRKKEQESYYPYIEDIDIQFPSYNRVVIEVMEKQIISYIPYMGKYLCIGKDGEVIDYIENPSEKIPYIKGLFFEYFVIGDKLLVENEQIFPAILEIYQKMQKFELDIEVIDFNGNDEKNIELEIENINVLLGDTMDSNTKFQHISGILREHNSNESYELDVSQGGEKFYLKKVD